MPEISVIVPVYNVEKYLQRCVDSILAQTFTDFELILIDDGSKDSSGAICDEYAEKDPRIVVIHKENGGASSARNRGLGIAQGSWISFVDSDDFVDANMYCDALALAKKHEADIVEFGLQKTNDHDTPDQCNKKIEEIVLSGRDVLPLIYQNCVGGTVYPWNKLFKAKLFSGVCFTEGRICEDTILLPVLYFKANKVVATNKVYYYYFQSAESVMRSEFSLKKLDAIYALRQNREFYQTNKLTEALIWHDTTYSFVLIKMMDKTREKYGIDCPEYIQMQTEFLLLLREFIKNRHVNMRQKLILLRYGTKIRKELRGTDR